MLNRLKKLGLSLFIAKVISVLGIKLESKIKEIRYSKNKSFFKIRVDDDNFEMSFSNYNIGKAIQERIDGIREPETTSIIKSLLRPGDKVLEIGGCYGYFTMLMANAVTHSGKVVSIESLPKNYEIQKTNIQQNDFKNIECYNRFIGKVGEIVEFDINDESNSQGISNINNSRIDENISKISVKCINIADFLNEIEFAPTYIFMDIEGFEVEAIEQLCSQYLEFNSPTFVFEHHESFYSKNKGLEYIRKLLIDKGYVVRKVYGNICAFKNVDHIKV